MNVIVSIKRIHTDNHSRFFTVRTRANPEELQAAFERCDKLCQIIDTVFVITPGYKEELLRKIITRHNSIGKKWVEDIVYDLEYETISGQMLEIEWSEKN
jgi:hypothetical protein